MTIQLDMFKEVVAPAPEAEIIQEGNVLALVAPTLFPSGAEALERRAARLREIQQTGARTTGTGTASNPKFAGQGFMVPTCGIACTEPEDMTDENFYAWLACIDPSKREDWVSKRKAKRGAQA